MTSPTVANESRSGLQRGGSSQRFLGRLGSKRELFQKSHSMQVVTSLPQQRWMEKGKSQSRLDLSEEALPVRESLTKSGSLRKLLANQAKSLKNSFSKRQKGGGGGTAGEILYKDDYSESISPKRPWNEQDHIETASTSSSESSVGDNKNRSKGTTGTSVPREFTVANKYLEETPQTTTRMEFSVHHEYVNQRDCSKTTPASLLTESPSPSETSASTVDISLDNRESKRPTLSRNATASGSLRKMFRRSPSQSENLSNNGTRGLSRNTSFRAKKDRVQRPEQPVEGATSEAKAAASDLRSQLVKSRSHRESFSNRRKGGQLRTARSSRDLSRPQDSSTNTESLDPSKQEYTIELPAKTSASDSRDDRRSSSPMKTTEQRVPLRRQIAKKLSFRKSRSKTNLQADSPEEESESANDTSPPMLSRLAERSESFKSISAPPKKNKKKCMVHFEIAHNRLHPRPDVVLDDELKTLLWWSKEDFAGRKTLDKSVPKEDRAAYQYLLHCHALCQQKRFSDGVLVDHQDLGNEKIQQLVENVQSGILAGHRGLEVWMPIPGKKRRDRVRAVIKSIVVSYRNGTDEDDFNQLCLRLTAHCRFVARRWGYADSVAAGTEDRSRLSQA